MTRKTVSLLVLFSFLMLAASSLALYVLPGGRTALPDQLLFLGIHKMTWRQIHITGGFLFAGAAIWHTALNLRCIAGYMKKSISVGWKNSPPLLIALAVTMFVYAGTVIGLEPMRTVLEAPGKQTASTTAPVSVPLNAIDITVPVAQSR